MAQNEEQIVVEEELTSYTSESAAPVAAAAQTSRPALTVAGAAVGRRKERFLSHRFSALDFLDFHCLDFPLFFIFKQR